MYQTKKCIICGKEATCHHGHLSGKARMALGNIVDIKILAGFCKEHEDTPSDYPNGQYGNYDKFTHGDVENFKIN